MTAAIAHLVRPSRRASLRGRSGRALAVLALVLPVPVCAALGLSLPLPASVARIAAKIVPFSNFAVLDAKGAQMVGARGSIVRVAGEQPAGSAIGRVGSRTANRPGSAAGADAPRGKIDGTTTASPNDTATRPAEEHGSSTPRETDPSSSSSGTTPPTGSTPSPVTGSTPPPVGSTPPPVGSEPVPPSSTPTVVDTAAGAATTVVGTVSNTATTATATVTDTAAATAATAGGVVTGATAPLLPKKP
jgi:hypothetical protein